MKGRPYRVKATPGGRFGRLIDHARPLSFRFDGRRMTGAAGDTLVSALMANGVRLMGRSFKLHRPRGVLGLGPEEPNALVAIGEGAEKTPNVRATQVPLSEGLVAESQNRWPSLRFDAGRVFGAFKPLLPAGFYYKTFKDPAKLWPFYERLIRRAAGTGRMPDGADPDRYEHVHLPVDVLVAGGGLAGIAAAEAAAAAGLSVLLAEESWRLGGIADGYDGAIDGLPVLDWIKARVAALSSHPNVHILTRAPVVALHDEGLAWIVETAAEGGAARRVAGAVRERLWKVRARAIIVATGAQEKPLIFPDNDRPGLMLATTARLMLRRHAVAPGRAAVIVTAGDEGYRTALDLREAGVEVERVVDVRLHPDSPMVHIVKAMGIPVTVGSAPVEVKPVWGGAGIDSIRVANRLTIEGKAYPREILCDTVLVSGGWAPAAQLLGHTGRHLPYDPELGAYRPGSLPDGLYAVGAANGVLNAAGVLEDAYAGAERAVGHLTGKVRFNRIARPQADITQDVLAEVTGMLPDTATAAENARAFADLHNDVTVGDLDLAVREGYRIAEHAKRYTTLGMGPDQGRTGNNSAALILARLKHLDPKLQPHTTYRPPMVPVSFGALAGARRGEGFLPVRTSPLAAALPAVSPVLEPAGLWRRPSCYPRPGESPEDAVRREVRAVRSGCGLLDASTLAKIVVAGPDAAAFLDFVCATDLWQLAVEQARYGLFLDEGGFVIDDGMVARLGTSRFLVSTTSGRAEKMADWLELWRQTEKHSHDVHIIDETERWGQVLVSGPKAGELAARLEGAPALLDGLRGIREGTVEGVRARVLRTRYTGETSFEIAVAAGHARALWTRLMDLGADLGVTPFGLQTLERLRLEAGYMAVGHETDGTVTPRDLGLGMLVSSAKSDFIGKFGSMRPDLTRDGRAELVGLMPEDTHVVPPPGTQIVADPDADTPRRGIGHVTSSGFSPTLGRGIALALIEGGRARLGESVHFLEAGAARVARITVPDFRATREAG